MTISGRNGIEAILRAWRSFIRLQRLSLTTAAGVAGLIVVGLALSIGGLELYLAGYISTGTLRAAVYFAVVGAAIAFWYLFIHFRYSKTLAYHDELTGLCNRKAIISAFRNFRSLAEREGRKVGVIYMDLDQFKPVNDRYGHDAGDELLRLVANILQVTVRESDLVARIGGDEFIILMTGSVTPQGVAECVARIRREVDRPIRLRSVRGAEVRVSASVGSAIYPDDGDDVHVLVDVADKRMFMDKQARSSAASP